MVLFDKGFNVQDLFLCRQVTCVLPPFVQSKRQFTHSEVYHGKRIYSKSKDSYRKSHGQIERISTA